MGWDGMGQNRIYQNSSQILRMKITFETFVSVIGMCVSAYVCHVCSRL